MTIIDASGTTVVREYVNGFWFVFALELFGLIVWKIWRGKHREGVTAAAVVAGMYLAAEALMRGWVWLLLKRQNDGVGLVDVNTIPLIAGVLAIAASLGAFWFFVPPAYRVRVVMWSIAIAAAFMGAAEFF